MKDLLKFNLNKYKFIFLDFETTGLHLLRSQPWDVSWHIHHGKNFVERHQYFFKIPNLKISEGAARVTGFNQKVLDEKGRDPKYIIDLLDSYLYNPEYIIVAANILNYDIFIHNAARLNLGYKTDYSYIDRIIDTNAISKSYFLQRKPPEDKKDFLPFQFRMQNFKQKGLKSSNATMAKEFGIALDETKLHGADYDVEITKEVFFNLVDVVDLIHYK